ncbi:hypothetical protein BDA96_09G065300 [Sorghum bicolor]|uniref:Uncharacterized protein n=1 Tax=Sorghum bicolor TaxID=4558 RepID=A0A921Q902_SORBI|nr:hypothetical protein BDA96_09G065300 [Sorghum bicolor]
MAAPSKRATGTSLISRTLERCKSGLNRIGAGRELPVAGGCFPVYVGPERVRFQVRAEDASHPLFRRLLDDAEREYGHAARSIALPCDVDTYLDVLWRMEDLHRGDGGSEIVPVAVSTMNPRSSPMVARISEHKETNNKLARTRSYS